MQNSDLRALPTKKPFFKNPSLAGGGYPFDYLQESRIYILYGESYGWGGKLDNNGKKEYILANAKPFRTLIYLKGHIMLYVGKDADGEFWFDENKSSILTKTLGIKDIY